MATKTYRLAAGADGSYAALVDGVDQAAANRADGWTVAKIAAGNSSLFDVGVKQASGTFSLNTTTPKPSALLTGATANALKTPALLKGAFANTAWSIPVAVRAVTASAQAGRVRLRVFRSANADGSGATEITGAAQIGTTTAALSATADQVSTVTWSPGALTLDFEYLFFVLAWEITTASGNNSGDVVLRTGQAAAGSRVVTPDFTDQTPVFPTVTVQDNFNRADAPVPGGSWAGSTAAAGQGFGIVGNRLGSGGFPDTIYWDAPAAADAEAFVTLPTVSANPFGLHARRDHAADTAYIAQFQSGNVLLIRRLAGAESTMGTAALALAAGDSVGISVVGSRIMAWHKPAAGAWTYKLIATDSAITAAGRTGLSAIVPTGLSWDDWGAAPATPRVAIGKRAAATVARGVTLTVAPSAVAVGRIGLSYVAEVLVDAPAGYWRMEEAGLPQDSSGTGKHLDNDIRTVPQAAGLLAADPASKARGFVVAGGGSLVSRGGLLFPFNVFSAEAWVKRTRSGVQECLLVQYNGGLGLWIQADGALALIKSFTGACAVTSALKITDTNTHHVVVTRDGIGGAVVFYLDGVAETPTPINPDYDFAASATNGFFVGSEWGTAPLEGTLDEVAVYPSVLSPARVAVRVAAGANSGTAVVRGITVGVELPPSTVPVGSVARATVARGVALAPGSVALPVGKRAAATTVRGATLAATGTVALLVGARAAATTTRGVTVVAAPLAVPVGQRAAATTTRGVTLVAAGAAPVTVGRRVAATTVRGTTLVATGTALLTVGAKAAATSVKGVTLVAQGALVPVGRVGASTTTRGVTLVPGVVSVPIGRRAAVTAVGGVTAAGAGVVPLTVGRRAAAATVRGVTLGGAGAAPIAVGRSAGATVVRGATLVGAGAATPVVVGRRAAAATVRGVTLAAAGAAPVPVGRRAAVATVGGVTLTGAGTVTVAAGRSAAVTVVRGLTLVAAGVPLAVGRRVAATTVRGATLSGTGTAAAVAVGRRVTATVVQGATLAGTGSVPLAVGRRAATSTTRGVTLLGAGTAFLGVGKRSAATTVRGVTLTAQGAPLAVGSRGAATVVRGATLAAGGAAPLVVGKLTAATTVRGATLVGTGVAPLPVGRRAAATTVRGATLTGGTGTATFTVGRRGASTVVRGVTIFQAVGRSWAVSYQLTAKVGRSTVLPYNVATRVARSLVVPYLVRQSAARSWVLGWQNLTPVGRSTVLLYAVLTRVGAGYALPYAVRERLGVSCQLVYVITNQVGVSWAIRYELTQAGVRGKSWALRYLVHLDTSGSAVVDPTANTVWIQAPEDTRLDPLPNTSGIEAMLRSVLDPSGVSTPPPVEQPPVEQGVRLCGEGLCGEGTCGGWGGGDDAVRAGRTDDQLFAAGGLPS